MTVEPSSLQVAARLRGVAGSPVREILALTARPGVISFAGGLPAPELFDAAVLAVGAVAALLVPGRRLRRDAVLAEPSPAAA